CERPRMRLPQGEGPRRCHMGGGPLDQRRASPWLALLVAARVIDRRLEEDCRMNDLVDHARAERAFWRELPRREDHVERARKADETRQPLRTAGGRDEPEARLGQADADVGGIRGDPRVARERDLEAASERRAVYRGDRDERERGEVVEDALHRTARLLDVALRCASSEERQVGAGDVLIPLAARDDETPRGRRARRSDRRARWSRP